MNFPRDDRIVGRRPVGIGIGKGGRYDGRRIDEGALFVFFNLASDSSSSMLCWSPVWEGRYSTCWWVPRNYFTHIKEIGGPGELESTLEKMECLLCKNSCKRDVKCAFYEPIIKED